MKVRMKVMTTIFLGVLVASCSHMKGENNTYARNIASDDETKSDAGGDPSKLVVESTKTVFGRTENLACRDADDVARRANISLCAGKGHNYEPVVLSSEHSNVEETNDVQEVKQGHLWTCTSHVTSQCRDRAPKTTCELSITQAYQHRLLREALVVYDVFLTETHYGPDGQNNTYAFLKRFEDYDKASEFVENEKVKKGCK